MNVFLVDLTHGGVKISSELAKSKNYEKVFGFDIYNTLEEEDECLLRTYNVRIIRDMDSFKDEIKSNAIKKIKEKNDEKDLIINPIHSSLDIRKLLIEIKDSINKETDFKIDCHYILNQHIILNHHQATELILSGWKEETIKQGIKTIEITGVKGKTSTAFLLKEIFMENNKDTLLLSSLGAYLFRKNRENNDLKTDPQKDKDSEQKLTLKKNISITPANIISTIQLAKKIANPKCSTFPRCSNDKDLDELIEEDNSIKGDMENPYNNLSYDIAIFENSLGITGLGDIGILTNLAENYSIAKGQSNAMEAKKQVFKSEIIVGEYETLSEHFAWESKKHKDKINSFSLDEANANVYCEKIDFDIDETEMEITYHDLKTIDGKLISGKLNIHGFAPGPHHVLNILASATSALALGINEEKIQNALSKFKGIEGRTNVRIIDDEKGLRIIEEINPGINTKAIERSISMIRNIKDYYIIIGGKYGVTCEEIDEDKLSRFLYKYLTLNPDAKLILTDELGNSLNERINELKESDNESGLKIKYIEDYLKAQEIAIKDNEHILFIYRSSYSQLSKR